MTPIECSTLARLGDLRTLFNYAAKNHRFPNPSDEVTLPKRTPRIMARNKWRSFTPDERTLILAEARKAGPVIRWCQWLGWGIGARVSEVAEASTLDIVQIGGLWCIKIVLDRHRHQGVACPVHAVMLAQNTGL
jgi:hypothetical protein